MKYRPLGRTGLRVSELSLGSMMFGTWGNAAVDDCVRLIRQAVDSGMNLVDTADAYSAGQSEEIVGRALSGSLRDNIILATKYSQPMSDEVNSRGGSRRWTIRAVEDSLRRLGTDWIDLYQLHRPDDATDIEETLEALTDLVHQGKIRYIGSSTFLPSQLVEAQWVARNRRTQRFVTEQPPYSMLVRGAESDLLPTAQRFSLGILTYSPLANGWLSGRWRKDAELPTPSPGRARLAARFDMSLPDNQHKLELVHSLHSLAQESGITLIDLAVAFALNHPAVTSVIIGPRTIEHLESQVGAVDVRLTTELLDQIDALVPPGTNVNSADVHYSNPGLSPNARRR